MKSQLNKSYQTEIEWLFHQFPSYQKIGSKAYKPTLENIQAITNYIDSPENELKFVHVAGSNGKGSTCSMLASTLTETGYKVGLFTSPHITDFNERIRINGEVISQDSVVNFIQTIKQHPFDFSPSFFEVTFAMALNYFRESKCDICIIETGLGGRLDATNIITPLLSVITNISLDHTDILGDTLDLIAKEKAGIIKYNVPVLVGRMSVNLTNLFRTISKEKQAPFHEITSEISSFDLPLLGDYQKDNFSLVLSALNLLKQSNFSVDHQSIQNGLNHLTKNTGYRGRLQVIEENPKVIYDVSHNIDGIFKTLATISKINSGQLHIIFGASNDKKIEDIIQLFPSDCKVYFSEFSNVRSFHLNDLKELTKECEFKSMSYHESPLKALQVAKNDSNQEDTILAIGSFFLISDVF